LERILPNKAPRGCRGDVSARRQKEKAFDDDHENREEKVVKAMARERRVRSSSISGCNTFLTWILDMTVGKLWLTAIVSNISMVKMWPLASDTW